MKLSLSVLNLLLKSQLSIGCQNFWAVVGGTVVVVLTCSVVNIDVSSGVVVNSVVVITLLVVT